jgi:hypothetical protein
VENVQGGLRGLEDETARISNALESILVALHGEGGHE